MLNWSLQKRVYIPFHFVPAQKFQRNKPKKFSFVTKVKSPFANWLLEEDKKEPNYRRRLCRIGVALHSYADTWAHRGFSGRLNKKENNVGGIKVRWNGDNSYEKISWFEQGVLNGLPAIGHAKASHCSSWG